MKKALTILLAAAFAGVSMGADDTGCGVSETPKVEKQGGGAAKTAGVGDRLTLKGTTYRVTDAYPASTLGETEYDQVTASGGFIVVKLTLTNRKDEPATILIDNIRVIGGNGKNYSVSDDAILAAGDDQLLLLDEIQPDVTERGTLVYDVPKKAINGARLQVKDLFSDSTGQIRLGL